MSEFTAETPFEHEGVKVWRDHLGGLKWFGGLTNDDAADALVAFREAERDSWHYTNDDKTKARKGRWTVEQTEGRMFVLHDDMGVQVLARHDQISWEHTNAAADIAREFAAWHAAQSQPSEPTGLGAVVEVNGLRYTRVPWHDGDDKPWMQEGDCWNWSQFASRGPVTVLAPGVDA